MIMYRLNLETRLNNRYSKTIEFKFKMIYNKKESKLKIWELKICKIIMKNLNKNFNRQNLKIE